MRIPFELKVRICNKHVRLYGHEYHLDEGEFHLRLQCSNCDYSANFNKEDLDAEETGVLKDPNFMSALNSGEVRRYFEDPAVLANTTMRVLQMYEHQRETGHEVIFTRSIGLDCTKCDLKVRWACNLSMPQHLEKDILSSKTFEDLLFNVPEFREKVLRIPSRFSRIR